MNKVIYVEDIDTYQQAPRYAKKLTQNLLNFNQDKITIQIAGKSFTGIKGIQSNIQYLYDEFQLIGSELSYTFTIQNQTIEISLQFYENTSNYWRLFSYVRCNNHSGMAFSINITKGKIKEGLYELKNKIKFSDRIEGDPDIAKAIRKRKQEVLCNVLVDHGFEVSNNSDVYLGSFSTLSSPGEFIDTNLQQFIEDIITVSLLKGHYMGNKGYSFDFLPKLN